MTPGALDVAQVLRWHRPAREMAFARDTGYPAYDYRILLIPGKGPESYIRFAAGHALID